MSQHSETLAEIVAMLRANARGERFDEFSFTSLADRIEAVWKREQSQSWHHREMEELVLRHEKELADARMSSGNAAKLREALATIRKRLVAQYESEAGFMRYSPNRPLVDLIDAALALPPRNCDMPLVVDGPANNNADKAWLVFKRHNPGAYFDVSGLLRCIDWLFAPATERKGESDGK